MKNGLKIDEATYVMSSLYTAEVIRSKSRKKQVGTGDRSERIRTYNYSQNRITDHRINVSIYNLEDIINEGNLMTQKLEPTEDNFLTP